MEREKNRRDKCKCGRFFYWSIEENKVSCPHCETEYKVDCDSILLYWLEEIIQKKEPYKTEMR
ncbi:MAG: hypothetical protein ABIE94_01595 [archaeon]